MAVSHALMQMILAHIICRLFLKLQKFSASKYQCDMAHLKPHTYVQDKKLSPHPNIQNPASDTRIYYSPRPTIRLGILISMVIICDSPSCAPTLTEKKENTHKKRVCAICSLSHMPHSEKSTYIHQHILLDELSNGSLRNSLRVFH